jgi:hypothetical protein
MRRPHEGGGKLASVRRTRSSELASDKLYEKHRMTLFVALLRNPRAGEKQPPNCQQKNCAK